MKKKILCAVMAVSVSLCPVQSITAESVEVIEISETPAEDVLEFDETDNLLMNNPENLNELGADSLPFTDQEQAAADSYNLTDETEAWDEEPQMAAEQNSLFTSGENDFSEEEIQVKWDVYPDKYMRVGEMQKLYLESVSIDNSYTFRSSNEQVITVDEDGTMHPISPGEASISLIFDNGLSKELDTFFVVKNDVEIKKGNMTWYIPEKVKVGYIFSEDCGETSGLSVVAAAGLPEESLGKIFSVNAYASDGSTGYDALKNCFLIAHAFGGYNPIKDTSFQYVQLPINTAIYPGTITFQPVITGEYDQNTGKYAYEKEVGEPYTVTIEEPVITANKSDTAYVGDSFILNSELQGTALQNELVANHQINWGKENHSLAYQPSYEVMEGADSIEQSEGDFTHTLAASEKLTFKKAGMVKIKIKYSHIPLCSVCENIFKYYGDYGFTWYEPEKIITIQVKDKPVITDISKSTISITPTVYTYDKKEKTPAVTVVNGSKTLKENVDYTVKYSSNINAGTAAVTISGIGDYTGTVNKAFVINKAANTMIVSKTSYTKKASAKAQVFSLNAKADSGTLRYHSNSKYVSVSDGKVTIAKNFAGKAAITITAGNANYETVTKKITITVNKIADTITASDFIKTTAPKARTFSIGAKRLGSGKLTYSSNTKSVTVNKKGKVTIAKNYVGTAAITIKAAASGIYKETRKKITVIVNPAATSVSNLKNSSSKTITVNWKKNPNVSGYQIQYAQKSNFSGAKKVTAAKASFAGTRIAKLTKGKTYYVRVRTYKTIGKKKYYSGWSSSRKIKITK